MNYQKLYDKAVKDKTAKPRTATYVKWDAAGHRIIGSFIGTQEVASRMGGEGYNQYLFDTDDGLVKFALGRNADHEIAPVLVEGGIYSIEYLGQEEISGGRKVNKFNVLELTEDLSDATADEN